MQFSHREEPPNALFIESTSNSLDEVLIVTLFVVFFVSLVTIFGLLPPLRLKVSANQSPTSPNQFPTELTASLNQFEKPSITPVKKSLMFPARSPIHDVKLPIHSLIQLKKLLNFENTESTAPPNNPVKPEENELVSSLTFPNTEEMFSTTHLIASIIKLRTDRKSTRLNSSHQIISYAV